MAKCILGYKFIGPPKNSNFKKVDFCPIGIAFIYANDKTMICDDFSTDVSKIYTIINLKKSFHFCLNSR